MELQSPEPDPRCFNATERSKLGLQGVPRTNQSLYSLECLHKYCELPDIPDNLKFASVSKMEGTHILETLSVNAKIIVVVSLRPIGHCGENFA